MPFTELRPPTHEARYFVQPAVSERLPLPRIEQMRQFVEIANSIGAITGTWNPVEIVTPDNVQIEKKRFLDAYKNGQIYNPVFTYAFADQFELGNSKQELHELERTVAKIVPTNQTEHLATIEKLAKASLFLKIRDDLATVDLVEGLKSRDDALIAKAVKTKYPGTDEPILEAARMEFDDRVNGRTNQEEGQGILSAEEIAYLRRRKFKAEEIRSAIAWMLNRYGLLKTAENPNGVDVIVDKNATRIDARDKSSKGSAVFIPEDREMDGIELLTVGQHELEHVRQSVNGQRLFVVGGGKMKKDDETFYEGNGLRGADLVTKKLLGKVEREPNPMYYVFAIHAAEQGASFYEIFTEQLLMNLQIAVQESDRELLRKRKDISDAMITQALDESWLFTYRAMRGHTDTTNAQKFAMPKDAAYMRGRLLDTDLRDKNLGFLNEAAIIASGGLKQLGQFDLSESTLPVPYQDVAIQYWQEVLQPQYQNSLPGAK